MKILIVDDEKKLCHIYKKFFSMHGYQTFIASSGDEGLKLIESESSIDIILLDLKMPGMSGIDFLKELKARNIDLPILMITGSIGMETIKEANELGFDKYVIKPISLAEIMESINKCLSLKSDCDDQNSKKDCK